MMDFFEIDVQICILKMISNVCMNMNREEDMQKLNTCLPALTNFLEVRGTSDKHSEMFGLMCTSFQYICDTPLKFKDPYSNLSDVQQYYKNFNQYGLMEKLYQFLFTASNSSKFLAGEASQPNESEDLSVTIILSNLGKIIKIVSHLCKYSSEHCEIAIRDMNMLNIINALLKREHSRDKASIDVLPETLSLLGALIPDSRSFKNQETDFAKNEKEKSIIFDEKEGANQYRVILVESILPSMFKLYVSAFNQNLKFTFLKLIEEIAHMLPGESLRNHIQPYLFSRFVITTMKSENYTWIEICLRILQILVDKKVNNCNLALYREGIKDYLSVFADKEKFKDLTGISVGEEEEEKKDAAITDLFDQEDKSESKIEELVKTPEKKVKEIDNESTPLDIVTDDQKEESKEEKPAALEKLPEPEVKQEPTEEAKEPKPDTEVTETTPTEALTSEPAASGEKSPMAVEAKSLSEKVSELKDQKEYLDELKSAIQDSIDDMMEVEEGADDTIKKEVDKELEKEEQKLEEESKEEKKKRLHQRKLKKMFIKNAIQNLDDNLEGLEDLGELDDGEIERIKDIIAKKKLLNKSKDLFNLDARKYSRDFIGINSVPMYKNIVNMSKTLLETLEDSLKEEFSKDAIILDRLTEISDQLLNESKNARVFDREKTVKIFEDLAEFFKGDSTTGKITQYELHKSKLVHAMHSFLCLPLKEEESKSHDKSKDEDPKQNVDEYFTILSRYLCLIEIFGRDENNKLMKSLMGTFENAMKISFSSYYQQELMAYHDGINLAYDLKKYSKRNKLQLVYEQNLEQKFAQQEAAEKGESYTKSSYKGSSVKQYLKAKAVSKPPVPKNEGESYEDEEFLKSIPAPVMEKLVSKQETPNQPLIEEIKKEEDEKPKSLVDIAEEHSMPYLKRDALYSELKTVAVSVENSSTLEVIKDFLRNKINCKEHIKQLKTHTNYGSISNQMQSIFEKARLHLDEQSALNPGETQPTNIQSFLSKMVYDTFNESGMADSIGEDEKLHLIKDLETLLGRTQPSPNPPPAPPVNPKTSEVAKPLNVIEEEEKELPKEEKKVKKEEEVKKKKVDLTPKSLNPVDDPEPSAETKLKSNEADSKPSLDSEDDEEEIDFGSKGKPKWDFFGKLKKFFFKDKDHKEDYYDEEGEGEEDEEEEKQEVTKIEEVAEDPDTSKTQNEKSAEKTLSEKQKERNNKLIDNPFSLKDLSDDEDVIFEFYYNRNKISDFKTIYEMIHYQPTHRCVADAHIIYFRIIDRKNMEEDEKSENSDDKQSETENDLTLRKERQLLKDISKSCEGELPVISKFMQDYISPYVKPDVKVKSAQSNYPNPYAYQSYNTPPVKNSNKIGISQDDQRAVSKKATRIAESVTYILKHWKEINLHLNNEQYEKINLQPDDLFKHLLDEYVQKLLMEPLNLVLESKKHKCWELLEILMANPYLLSFDTRVFFLKTAAFAYSGEFHRTVHFLIQHLRRKHPSLPDQAIPKQSKEKIKIDRKNLLESTVKLFTTPGRVKRKNFLEIEYCNEEGTGLGPTLEFYYLCSKEFRNLKGIWRETEDNSLFPAPLEVSSKIYGEEKVLRYFEAMGAVVSRAISDDRLTDLPFSQVFWDLCSGQPKSFNHITQLDSTFGKSVSELREYCIKRENIKSNPDLDDQIRERQLEACKLKNGATVEDLCLFFVIPGTDVELKPKGKDLQVTDQNLKEYLELLLVGMLENKQIDAFKKGFGKNIKYLRLLKPNEVELIVCGNNDDDKEWTTQNLKEHIVPAHGYHENSDTYLNLIEYMVKLDKEKRRQFLTFVTGSPRLPLGGFKNLKPKMNIVRKNEGSANPNIYLPSVMTCQNFLKIPDYSSFEILSERFDVASKEGQENFTLS